MKIIFSRKGWDSAAGGAPSPILEGTPISMPIPDRRDSPHRYGDITVSLPSGEINLGDIAPTLTRRPIRATTPAHQDPMFHSDGTVSFGQTGTAQAHLENQGVGPGDVFLFFGLFQDRTAARDDPDSRPHHRIFGFLEARSVHAIGESPFPDLWKRLGLPETHPHIARRGNGARNTLWRGTGCTARTSPTALRLSVEGQMPSLWRVPAWLKDAGLSYHSNPALWTETTLRAVARGQEFVTDIGEDPTHPAQSWLRDILATISAEPGETHHG